MYPETFALTNKTKSKPPRLPYLQMKEKVLGKHYILSIVLIGKARSKSLNNKYRKKNKPANVLSFPLGSEEGEIFIDLGEAKKQATSFRKSFREFTGLLFIHGLLHLKGFDHGGKMDRLQRKYLKAFRLDSELHKNA